MCYNSGNRGFEKEKECPGSEPDLGRNMIIRAVEYKPYNLKNKCVIRK